MLSLSSAVVGPISEIENADKMDCSCVCTLHNVVGTLACKVVFYIKSAA